jgi:hypothetical protein
MCGGISIIAGGQLNTIGSSTSTSFLGGGQSNFINGELNSYHFIGAGNKNLIRGGSTGQGKMVIVGGQDNTASSDYNFIGGGCGNKVGQVSGTGPYSAILGGQGNIISGSSSNIGGGVTNKVIGNYSGIASGRTNEIGVNADYATIASGFLNCIEGSDFTFLGGGCENKIQAIYGFLGGGFGNSVTRDSSVIVGGRKNSQLGISSFIGAGCRNMITYCSPNTSIVGGMLNTASTDCCSFMAGGCNNTSTGHFNSTLAGENLLTLGSNSCHNVTAGNCNTTIGQYNSVFGCRIQMDGTAGDSKLSNNYNLLIGDFIQITASCFIIGNGSGNIIDDSNFSIIHGFSHQTTFTYTTNLLGSANSASYVVGSTIAGGAYNIISGSANQPATDNLGYCLTNRNLIGAGAYNIIQATSKFNPNDSDSFHPEFGNNIIGAGEGNKILEFSHTSVIGGGCNNIICNANLLSAASTQCCNKNNCSNVIVGGDCNAIRGCCGYFGWNFIGGGCCNVVEQRNTSNCYGLGNNGLNVVVGGYGNCIVDNNCCTAIQCYQGHNFIGGGCKNLICLSFGNNGITHGICNEIIDRSCRSVIIGGYNNTIKADGSGNGSIQSSIISSWQSNMCHDNSHIIGLCSFTSLANNTTYVCNLCVVGTLSKGAGSFHISHPNPSKSQTHDLVHSFVESPTGGDNIYRFSVTTVNNKATIVLPEYYNYLNKDNQLWVSADGHFGQAYGLINKEVTKVEIISNIDGDYNVMLVGTRKDKHVLESWKGVERLK